jgi:hypothetical protein
MVAQKRSCFTPRLSEDVTPALREGLLTASPTRLGLRGCLYYVSVSMSN